MKCLLKIIGLMLALPVLLVIGFLLWTGARVIANKPSDDKGHMAAKAEYLRGIAALAAGRHGAPPPNILIFYYDDLGYGDLGFTGGTAIKTPNIDALANSGVVLGNYHSPSPVCSPSRAAMLTGRLPPRAGVPDVLFPTGHPIGYSGLADGFAGRLPAEEITIADVLKADGYRTGMIGKWHLGDRAPSFPNNFGFEHFFGAHYSNDMKPFAIWRDGKVVIPAPADQTKINDAYTQEAISFIKSAPQTGKPFFLYFAHNFPHRPLFTEPGARGRSAAGLYGDVVESLDDGVGRVVAALKDTGQLENTIVILTSDNGPWYEGSPGNFRGRKGQTFEGGMHVPFLISWPSGLAGGRTINAATIGTGIAPTLYDWLGLPLPGDRQLDGVSMRPLLEGKAASANGLIYYYASTGLMAVSDGHFKYHKAQPIIYAVSNMRFTMATQEGPWLFDLSADPQESYDVAMKYPAEADRLKAALEARDKEVAANPRGWVKGR